MGNKNLTNKEKEKVFIQQIYSPYEKNVKLLVMHKTREDLINERMLKENFQEEKENLLRQIENFVKKDKNHVFIDKLSKESFCIACSKETNGWFCIMCLDFICNICSKNIEIEQVNLCETCKLFEQIMKIKNK